MSAINFTGTLGGHDHSFCLTLDAVEELEKATTSGIGALTDRILHRQFRQSDLVHVLRLGLIGAGTPPAEAELLVKSSLHPLAESWGVAVELITRLWSGETKESDDEQD